MIYDMNKVLKDHKGEVIKEDDKEITLKEALEKACLYGVVKDADFKTKFNVYKIAKKIVATEKVELSSDEIELLKNLVGSVYSPIGTGSIIEALENP